MSEKLDISLLMKSVSHYSHEVVYMGETIARSTSPEHAACRVLEARGIRGTAYFWREGKATWDIRMDIVWGAQNRADF